MIPHILRVQDENTDINTETNEYQPHILEASIGRVEISLISCGSNLSHDNVSVQFYRHSGRLRIYSG